MIQVCSYCRKIYGEKEPYGDQSLTLTHGICPDCYPGVMEKMLKELEEYEKTKKNPPFDTMIDMAVYLVGERATEKKLIELADQYFSLEWFEIDYRTKKAKEMLESLLLWAMRRR